MDQELATYLDRRFAEQEARTRRIVDQPTQGLATKEQLEGLATKKLLEEKLEGLATKKLLEEKLEELATKEQLEELELATKKQLDDQFRRTQVLIEDLRGGLERVAEGVFDMNAKFDQQREENEKARREDRAFFNSLFRDVKGQADDHETRITRLESAGA